MNKRMADEMADIIERALNVVKQKEEWITYIKKFNDHYPNFKQKYNTSIIIDELLESFI